MPNIIEQQDLLKGLPDARLAMLLQNPAGDIPPFLVAAEAQRRQAIRQQFAGSENQESVVDTLTKQLVPQNIQAPPKAPPVIPPTPQMQGVAALQQQQMQQPQEMRGGGMVQRYQAGGAIIPTVESLAARMRGMSLEEYKRMLEAEKIARLGLSSSYMVEVPPNTEDLMMTPEDLAEFNKSVALPKTPVGTMTQEDLADFNKSVALPSAPVGPARKAALPANTPPPKPDETPYEYRARLEELLAAQEPSDWEKAQKYFAMAEQFLDPSKTTMQSVAGAGRAFAESASEQARAQREAEIGLKKGLLEYDISKAEELRAKKLREAETKKEALKARTEIATGQLDDLRRERRDIAEMISVVKSEAMKSGYADDPEVSQKVRSLQDAYDELGRKISTYENFISQAYNFPLIETADLSAGQILKPSE